MTLPVAYEPNALTHVQLGSGESDELDIQVMSQVACARTFQVVIVYRVANQADLHTLTLPQMFTVDFASATSWRPYTFQDGRLTPQR